MFYKVSEVINSLEDDSIESEAQMRGKAKKDFAKIFDASLDHVYVLLREEKKGEPKSMVFCDPETGVAKIMRETHRAEFKM